MRYLRGTYTPRYVGGSIMITMINDKAHVSFFSCRACIRKKKKKKRKREKRYPILSYRPRADFG